MAQKHHYSAYSIFLLRSAGLDETSVSQLSFELLFLVSVTFTVGRRLISHGQAHLQLCRLSDSLQVRLEVFNSLAVRSVSFDVDLNLLHLIDATVRIVREDGREADGTGSLDALFEFLREHAVHGDDLVAGSEAHEAIVSDDKMPGVALQVRVMLRVHVAGSLTFLEVQELDLQLASEDVTDDDFVFVLDLGSHGKLDNGKSINAQLLLLELLLELGRALGVTKDLLSHLFSFGSSLLGVRVQVLLVHERLDALALGLTEARKLTVGVLVDAGAGEQVLLELNDGEHVLGKDSARRPALSEQRVEKQRLLKQDIEEMRDRLEHSLEVLSQRADLEVLLGEDAMHETCEQNDGLDLDLRQLRVVHLRNVALNLLVFAELLEESDLVL